MKKTATKKRIRRVAISIEMDWGFKCHLEVYAGCQRYADEAGWDCSINPAVDRDLKAGGYDGVIARTTQPLAVAARKARVPVVNVWLNSPVENQPSVSGTMPSKDMYFYIRKSHIFFFQKLATA